MSERARNRRFLRRALPVAVAAACLAPSAVAHADETDGTEGIQLHRAVAFSAGERYVGQTTNAWGAFPGADDLTVRTEVQLDDSRWVASQTGTTDADGEFVLPLTYGATTPGTTTWRVAGVLDDGDVVHTPEFTLHRHPLPTANTAGTKFVGQTTSTWGRLVGTPDADVWSEVQLADGRWVRSQTTTVDADGDFVIPLTYGANSRGTTNWRVASEVEGGVVRSEQFSLQRRAMPTAATAGSKGIGASTNLWGTLDDGAGLSVWSEVQLADGRWVRSQTRTTDERGFYAIPLTYGASKPGTTTWRVAGQYPSGEVVRSTPVTLTREGFDFSPCANTATAERGLTTQTRNVMRAICHAFPDLTRYIGNQGRSYYSSHSYGKGIDVMVYGPRGWDVANLMREHADELRVTEIIYERRIWTKQRASEGWRWMSDRGNATANHYDHVHLSVDW